MNGFPVLGSARPGQRRPSVANYAHLIGALVALHELRPGFFGPSTVQKNASRFQELPKQGNRSPFVFWGSGLLAGNSCQKSVISFTDLGFNLCFFLTHLRPFFMWNFLTLIAFFLGFVVCTVGSRFLFWLLVGCRKLFT